MANGDNLTEQQTEEEFRTYAETTRRGIIGESYFQSLIVQHAIPHQISRENDLGVDFICEWVHQCRPTGLQFLAQVKSSTTKTVKPKLVKERCELNLLGKFTLQDAKQVHPATWAYWRGLGLPAFLFYVIEDEKEGELRWDCYYKRCTPRLAPKPGEKPKGEAVSPSQGFYKVNEGVRFLAFADDQQGITFPEGQQEIGGFARDLIIDFTRLSYSKGQIFPFEKDSFGGLWPLPWGKNEDSVKVIGEFVKWYRPNIQAAYEWTREVLEAVPEKD